MKNLTIIHPFNPQGRRAGGIGTFIKGIIKYAPSNIQVSLVGICSEKDVVSIGKWQPLTVAGKSIQFCPIMVECDENKRQLLPLSIRFTWKLFRTGLDFTAADLFFQRLEPALLFLNKRNRKFFVFHNDIDKFLSRKDSEVLWAKIPWLYLKLERWTYQFAEHVLTVNGNTLSFYKKKYRKFAEKFDFIPTWVDSEIFYSQAPRSAVREELVSLDHIARDKKWILYVGRLQKQKRPEMLIQVIAGLEDGEQLLIVGEGNLQNELEQLCRERKVVDRVHFLGTMGQDKLRELYQAADLFLLTSNFEGMPMCVLEAQACGLPVVTTPVGEVGRIILQGKSGVVTEDHDLQTILSAVQSVLSSEGEYSSAHCVDAVSGYTAKAVVGQMMKVFYGEG